MISQLASERLIFDAAIDAASPADRAAYLDRACGNDPKLRAGVEALLAAHDRLGSIRPAATADELGGTEGPGAVIGPYTLRERVGEGGMGVVYVAEQTHPVKRRVALKVIKPGMDTQEVVARFGAERQALALMDHPNIAKIHDAGATAAGRPYFVMELVRGLPITDYCDQARLPADRRLRLFAQVCRAVQHAHQKGIIHRDLKPSNVLVTLHDGEPVPKVIDFGVAKAVDQQLTDKSVYTGLTQMVGTPMYMAPEQAELSGLDIDTRSDVYALGVLLYELLTGTTPFDAEAFRRAGFDEMRRMIREDDPPRPSARVSTLDAQARSTAAGRRGLDDRQLTQLLRGDLDWIVTKALEKDRTRRYESAGAFAADVERYLADEPVEARPPSAWYRLRKFARRHTAALVAASVVAATLMAATGVSTWQAAEARDAQHRAEAAEGRAATEAAIATAVSDFFQHDLLRHVDTKVQRDDGFMENPNLTMKEALHRAATRIGDRFQDQPLVEAAIRRTIGDGYRNLGEARRATPHLERALALHKAHLGSDHPVTYGSTRSLAQAYQWVGRRAESIALFEQILAYRTVTLGPEHVDTLDGIDELADACEIAGQWPRAKLLLEQVLEKRRLILGPMHQTTAESMRNLAFVLAMLGRQDESFDLYEKTLKVYEATVGLGHPAACVCIKRYARVCQRAGELDKADRLLRLALERTRNQEAPPEPVFLALLLDNFGRNLLLQKKYAEAEPVLRETVTIHELYRRDVWRRFSVMSNLGGALLGQKQYAAAEPLLLQGYEGMQERRALMQAGWDYRLTDAVEFLVRLYDETNQPDKARAWREKLPPEKRPPS